jgi:arylsulfatase A-like enzyme
VCGQAFSPSVSRPNIVFILADDLGYGHVGCYGQERIQTPNIDRLADEGMRFTSAYSGSSVCAPSRSVFLTGFHGGHTSIRANVGGIPFLPEDVTIGEVLKEAGYVTGIFGKWGMGDEGTTGVPVRQGFDEFFGYLHHMHAHFHYPEYLFRNGSRYPLPANSGGKHRQFAHDLIVDEALRFIRRHKSEPFFCYLPLVLPHWALLVPEDSLAEYRGKFPETPYVDRC